jgi:hypothetical protein
MNSRSLQNQINIASHSPTHSVHDRSYILLSLLIFQAPPLFLPENNCHTLVSNAQPWRHSIFSPQIKNPPLPITASPSLCLQSIYLPTPTLQHNNDIFAPQPVYPISQYIQNFSPSINSTYISHTTHSSQSTHSQLVLRKLSWLSHVPAELEISEDQLGPSSAPSSRHTGSA